MMMMMVTTHDGHGHGHTIMRPFSPKENIIFDWIMLMLMIVDDDYNDRDGDF